MDSYLGALMGSAATMCWSWGPNLQMWGIKFRGATDAEIVQEERDREGEVGEQSQVMGMDKCLGGVFFGLECSVFSSDWSYSRSSFTILKSIIPLFTKNSKALQPLNAGFFET